MKLDPEWVRTLAGETGFRPAAVEKVLRLGSLAADLTRHPFLSKVLVLKGGAALNLCFGAPRRLSVDLDFNYIATASPIFGWILNNIKVLKEVHHAERSHHRGNPPSLIGRRRGKLLGGDEGRALCDAADAWMRTQSICDPQKTAAQMAPARRHTAG